MSKSITIGGKRCGKSLALAEKTAAAMREGKRAATWSAEHAWEEIVAVPGFADGRQLPKS